MFHPNGISVPITKLTSRNLVKPLIWKSINTVWPQAIWKKLGVGEKYHRSIKVHKYLGGPESASIEIPPFQTSLHKISKVVFFRLTNFFFRNKKKFVQGTTFVQFFMYCKAKKNFGAIIFFWNLLSKFGSERGDFNWCWFWAS